MALQRAFSRMFAPLIEPEKSAICDGFINVLSVVLPVGRDLQRSIDSELL
jgi:hypothetical protein